MALEVMYVGLPGLNHVTTEHLRGGWGSRHAEGGGGDFNKGFYLEVWAGVSQPTHCGACQIR